MMMSQGLKSERIFDAAQLVRKRWGREIGSVWDNTLDKCWDLENIGLGKDSSCK